jgi:hypothetical protein
MIVLNLNATDVAPTGKTKIPPLVEDETILLNMYMLGGEQYSDYGSE